MEPKQKIIHAFTCDELLCVLTDQGKIYQRYHVDGHPGWHEIPTELPLPKISTQPLEGAYD